MKNLDRFKTLQESMQVLAIIPRDDLPKQSKLLTPATTINAVGSSYIDSFMNQIRDNRKIIKPTTKQQLTPSEDIKKWWEQMPDVQREPYYTMRWLVDTLGYAPSIIGPVLCQLGWKRGRSWRKDFPFGRTWVPPTQNNETGCDL